MLDSVDSTKAFQIIVQNIGLIITYVGVGLTAVGVTKAKDWFDARRARRGTRRAVKNSVVLNAFLGEVRALTGVDRVTVLQFHNGEHFASGASVQKVSMTHCIVDAGVSMPVGVGGNENLQSIPSTFMTALLNSVFNKGYVVYNDNAPDTWVQRVQTANGAETSVICLIPGSHPQEALGLLDFTWTSKHKVSKECVATLLDYARRTATYL